jgi:hypothetical protein
LKSDISDVKFDILPTITVTQPNTGTFLQVGSVQNIKWQTSVTTNYYNIDYSINGGSTWINIVTNHYTTSGSYAWTVPNNASTNVLVRVSDYYASCKQDVNDQALTISTSAVPIVVVSPNKGEVFTGCSTQNITWTTNGTTNNFNIQYSINGGLNWTNIVSNYNTTLGTYAWQVPAINASNVYVRVTDAGAPTKFDVSDSTFAITTTLPVVTTSGSTTFCSGNNVVLTAPVGSAYVWSNNGTPIPGQTSSTYTAGFAGNYTVTVTNGTCVSTSNPIAVTVNSLPSAPITAGGVTTFCDGASVVLTSTGASAYTWQKAGVDIVGQTSSSYTATTSGSYTVTTSNGLCTKVSVPIVVTVNPAPDVTVSTSGSTSICNGSKVVLSVPAGNTYVWKNGSATIGGQTSSSYTATTAGTYTVTATQGVCSATSVPKVVTVNNLPVVSLTPIGTLCSTVQLPLTGGNPAGGTYSGSFVNAGVFDAIAAGLGTHQIKYSYTDANSCANSDSVMVLVDLCTGVMIEDLSKIITASPNPFDNFTLITVGNAYVLENATLKLLDNKGVEIRTYSNINSNVIQINRDELSTGLYIFQIINHQEVIGIGKLTVY